MEYLEFTKSVRDMFDNVYAIHWKRSSIEHIQEFVEYLRANESDVQFYTPDSTLTKNIDFDYIDRYFLGKEPDFPSLEIIIEDLKFNCFLECESTISLWFNDSSDSEVTFESFNLIKSTMKELASTFGRTMYFVNEGESTHRYKIFKITSDSEEFDYDLSGISKCAEKLEF